VTAGVAAENAEFMLKRNNLEPAVVQELCRTNIVLRLIVVDLKSNRRRIVIGLAVVGHRDDDRLQIRPRRSDSLLKVGRERGYATPARQRIADECDPI
jgi:hypothetical protein